MHLFLIDKILTTPPLLQDRRKTINKKTTPLKRQKSYYSAFIFIEENRVGVGLFIHVLKLEVCVQAEFFFIIFNILESLSRPEWVGGWLFNY